MKTNHPHGPAAREGRRSLDALAAMTGRLLDRVVLLRAGITALVFVAVEIARFLLGAPEGFVADIAALYLSLLLGGLFTLNVGDGTGACAVTLDHPVGVAAFLLAPVGPVMALAVLAAAVSAVVSPEALTLEVGATVLGAAVVALLGLLVATALMPTETWSEPPGRDALALVANGAADLAATLFRPGAVAAGVLFLAMRLV